MALFPRESFFDASEPEIATGLSDEELAMNSVVERHGEIPDAEVERLAILLDEYCSDMVIEKMFGEDYSYAQFAARQPEFEAACRQKIIEYGEGKFDLPQPSQASTPPNWQP